MIIRVVLTTLFTLTIVLAAQAQVEYGLSRTLRIYAPNFTPYSDVGGTPYIPGDSAQSGWILYGHKRVPARLRYNTYTGEVEYVENHRVLTPTNAVLEFTILYPDTLHFRRGFPSVDTRTPAGFYQILFNGRKMKLLRYVHAEIQTNTEQMSNDFGKKSFRQRDDYYVWTTATQPPNEDYFEKLSEGEMKPVLLSKKSLIIVAPNHADQIEHYVADKKIKLRSWTEFADVLKYLDSQ